MTGGPPIAAKGATRYDLRGMGDEDFESLVARLIRIEFPEAVKPANTNDGGADMALAKAGGGYARCWQSKHFPGTIAWEKCLKSFADAVRNWAPDRYTFCFPRDLTSTEQKTFDKHFRAPDAAVVVDHWNGTELEARLNGSAEGERVARTFFHDVALDREETYRAIEAGGRTKTVEDVADRLANLGSVLAGKDAFFSYPATTHESDSPGPPLTPGTVMSFGKSDGTISNRIDAVPRDEDALQQFGPEFVLQPSPDAAGASAAARLEEALSGGKEVEITDGLDLTFTRLPPGFADLIGKRLTGGTLRLSSPEPVARPIPPMKARLIAVSDAGSASFDVLMKQTDTPEEWDGALTGRRAGLTVTARFRWRGEGGQVGWNFQYARDDTRVRVQLESLNFIRALSGKGELSIVDLGPSKRPEQHTSTVGSPLAPEMVALITLFEHLRTIEEWASVEFELPDNVTSGEAAAVVSVARIVRDGGRPMVWRDIEMTIPEENLEPLRQGLPVRIEETLHARILGSEITLGHTELDITGYRLVRADPAPSQPGSVSVRLESQNPAGDEVFERLITAPKPRRHQPAKAKRRRSKHKGKGKAKRGRRRH